MSGMTSVPWTGSGVRGGHRVRYADTAYLSGLMEAIDKMERLKKNGE